MTAAGKEYGYALFSLTEERGTTEAVLSDIEVCRNVFESHPSYAKLMDTPAVAVGEKLSLIDEAFSSVDEDLKNLIKILCEKHSVYEFPAVAKEYLAFYNEARGICGAEVISAIPLTESQMAKMTEKLSAITGKKVTLTNKIDKSILGGVKLRYEGKQLDASLKTKLDSIEKSLRNAII